MLLCLILLGRTSIPVLSIPFYPFLSLSSLLFTRVQLGRGQVDSLKSRHTVLPLDDNAIRLLLFGIAYARGRDSLQRDFCVHGWPPALSFSLSLSLSLSRYRFQIITTLSVAACISSPTRIPRSFSLCFSHRPFLPPSTIGWEEGVEITLIFQGVLSRGPRPPPATQLRVFQLFAITDGIIHLRFLAST